MISIYIKMLFSLNSYNCWNMKPILQVYVARMNINVYEQPNANNLSLYEIRAITIFPVEIVQIDANYIDYIIHLCILIICQFYGFRILIYYPIKVILNGPQNVIELLGS